MAAKNFPMHVKHFFLLQCNIAKTKRRKLKEPRPLKLILKYIIYLCLSSFKDDDGSPQRFEHLCNIFRKQVDCGEWYFETFPSSPPRVFHKPLQSKLLQSFENFSGNVLNYNLVLESRF